MDNLAATYQQLGHYEDAMSLATRVLEARKEILGERHPNTLSAMGNLALTWMALGWVQEAISLATKAAEGFETVLGKEHQDTLECKENLEGIKNVLKARESLDIAQEKMDG
jgi:tetratricopeptide (TPR) repeat protein